MLRVTLEIMDNANCSKIVGELRINRLTEMAFEGCYRCLLFDETGLAKSWGVTHKIKDGAIELLRLAIEKMP